MVTASDQQCAAEVAWALRSRERRLADAGNVSRINVASPHGDARVVVAGPAHGDVYRDGWRREEVLAEPQGRFGESVETLGAGRTAVAAEDDAVRHGATGRARGTVERVP